MFRFGGHRFLITMSLTLRTKLALLAGIPLLGAVALSISLVQRVQREAVGVEALGSVESVGEMSRLVTATLTNLQLERAVTALQAGQVRRGQPPIAEVLSRVRAQADESFRLLTAFLELRDLTRLPPRLSEALEAGRQQFDDLHALRRNLDVAVVPLRDILTGYRATNEELISATAALTAITDDGELLRLIGALVSTLEVEERASQEHALLSYVFANGEFPPGSYRDLVHLVSEEQTHLGSLRTTAVGDDVELLARLEYDASTEAAQSALTSVLSNVEEAFPITAEVWFAVQGKRVEELAGLANELNDRVHAAATMKRKSMERAIGTSLTLVAFALTGSVFMAIAIARGVNRSVSSLHDAARRVGTGDLQAKAVVTSRDELGALGEAFNDMTHRLSLAKDAEREQLRLTSELRVAASIQTALLPSAPRHPDFDFAGKMIPADEVGGDFYDILSDASDSLWLTIGDVSSHGLGAGLVMLMTQAAFAARFHSDARSNPDEVFMAVNRVVQENIAERLRDNKYVTAQLWAYRGQGRFCV